MENSQKVEGLKPWVKKNKKKKTKVGMFNKSIETLINLLDKSIRSSVI